jgi:acetyl esterase/lipase
MKDIKQHRDEFDQLGKLYPQEASVKVEQATINGVNTYWFTPQDSTENKIIIWLHGGVYALGSVRSHGALVSHVASKLKTKVLFVDYALSPEHPYPAANHDVFAVYSALLEEYPGYKIGFIGDSAGGGLSVSTVSRIIKEELPLPYAVAMLSPWIDLTAKNPSYETNKDKDPILSKGLIQHATADYLGGTAIEVANPKDMVLSAFPPVLIAVGTNEVLEDDSRNFYYVVRRIQPDSILSIYEDQLHVWPLANIHSEASQRFLGELADFFYCERVIA